MRYLKEYIVPIFVTAAALLSLFFFRSVPSGKLWDGYTVLYVSGTADDAVIDAALAAQGCGDVISRQAQRVPLSASMLPEISLAPADGGRPDSYLSRRDLYFFDRTAGYKVCYVPDEYKGSAVSAAAALDGMDGVTAGIDTAASYPWIPPAVCALFAVFLTVCSVRRILFVCAAAFPVLFSAAQPSYAVCAGMCMALLCIFIAVRVIGRAGAAARLSRNVYAALFLFLPAAICFFSGLRTGLLFALALCAVLAVAELSETVPAFFGRRYSFRPVRIRPAGMIPLVTERTRLCMTALAAAIAVLLVSALFSVTLGGGFSGRSVLLPSSRAAYGSLPDLDDYIAWKWTAVTEPYVSLNGTGQKKAPADGDEVRFPRYADSPDGITATEDVIVFGPEFRRAAADGVDALPYPAIEKMMKRQGRRLCAGYSSSDSQSVTPVTVTLLAALLLLAVLLNLPALRGAEPVLAARIRDGRRKERA